MELDYEDSEFDEESEKGDDIKETHSELYPLGIIPDEHTLQGRNTNYICSLEEEVANLKPRLFTTEARAVRAEQKEDEITREMSELVELRVRHFSI
ncbi:unnamed protein product [Lactuca saligna]|uniref:Uncharacterized protein n=1 Tax=Lactuca saligna TaxID=75948 RepID=A0AA36EFV9_LACSI|nr:unnamed protein product [Lactuca saligna]